LLHGADELRRLVLERVRIVCVDRQDGMTGFGVPQQRVGQPGRELVKGVARRVTVTNQLQRFVAPERFDVTCTSAIGAFDNHPDQWSGIERCPAVCNRSDDEQPLMRLQVEGNLHGELAVGGEHGIMINRHRVPSQFVAYRAPSTQSSEVQSL